MLELRTNDRVEQDPPKQQDLFGGTHPQALSLQGHTVQCKLLGKLFKERKTPSGMHKIHVITDSCVNITKRINVQQKQYRVLLQ